MQCPKCHHHLLEEQASCPQCGIVFAKYFKYHPEAAASQPDEPASITISNDQEISSLFQEAPIPGLRLLGRLVIFIGLVIWSWQLIGASIASNAVGESFLHNINLPFHEAGHIVFRPFGAFITSLGGTLGQLLMPSVCAGVLLLKSRDPFGASVALWWVGENFLDIAPYVNDARAGMLPLLGGNFGHSAPYGFHDWQYLLTESGLLQYDHALAKMAYGVGALIMLFSLYGCGFLLQKQYGFWCKNNA
ncbi:MAG: zinc ribbon domain-containing protein [Methylovulum sp.]|uniref:zinc ribbon domain-containing protein n=1 Tax=Methylovulum sp. TaxID=1916980 RepID=UPI00262D4403|nr:zinc ribbon domain-containing protein [Methylovulum sp.]MDD2725165.1 zinc ribbon domain-containing protein [Methylovulum sp.]MDD5125559.1 zinc ribbon domain-containing protein [Methylovulum sp.]